MMIKLTPLRFFGINKTLKKLGYSLLGSLPKIFNCALGLLIVW